MPSILPPGTAPSDANARAALLNGQTDVIPPGDYCYAVGSMDPETGALRVRTCPYWAADPSRPRQENGYCALLRRGDWESDGISLLWDQVKECEH